MTLPLTNRDLVEFLARDAEAVDLSYQQRRALRAPAFRGLAHPRRRIFNFRAGLRADWRRVFDAAAAVDRAVEIDAYPDRQDLDVDLLAIARASGVCISIGSDAHAPRQLSFAPLGSAAALAAGIPRDRIFNFMPRDALLAWSRTLTDRVMPSPGGKAARTRTSHAKI